MSDPSSASSTDGAGTGAAPTPDSEADEIPSFVDPNLKDTRPETDRRARSSLCLYVSKAVTSNQDDPAVREIAEVLTKKVGGFGDEKFLL